LNDPLAVATTQLVWRAELACLARVLGFESLLYLDGGLGLLDLAADLDAARASLASLGALESDDPRPIPVPDHPLVAALVTLRDAPVRVDVVADEGRKRRCHTMGIVDGRAVSVSPTELGPMYSFSVRVDSADAQLGRVRNLLNLGPVDRPEILTDVPNTAFRLRMQDLFRVRGYLEAESHSGAIELLISLGWSSSNSTDFVVDMSSKPEGYGLRVCSRSESRVTIDELNWCTSETGRWWLSTADRAAGEVAFEPTTNAVIQDETDLILEAIS
jgi:hypothetical protein